MTETRHYDVIVIGTGQAGKPLAGALADTGYKTAIVSSKSLRETDGSMAKSIELTAANFEEEVLGVEDFGIELL